MADKDSNLIIGIDGDTKDFKNALKSLESVAKTALKGLTAGFATVSAGIASAVMVGANFEQQMKNVQAISGATGAEFEALTAKAREMGIQTAFSATEAGQAFEYMAMAGWDTQAMLDGISGIMDLAAASGEELALVSDIVTDALTAFGLQAKDSAHFADVLAMASSKSNTNIQMLGYSFKYVAPTAGALKFSVEDVAVALGLMANAGIKSEQAGTSLRALFTRLVNPPKDAAMAIERLGLAVQNADGTMRPLNDIIIDIRKGFANLSDAEKASVAGALAGQEAMSGLLAIVNAGEEDFQKLTQAINNATGEAQRMADVKLDSLSGAWKIFKSTVQETGIIIYDSLKTPLKEGVQEATKSINELNQEIKSKLTGDLDILGQKIGNLFVQFGNVARDVLPEIIEALGTVLDNLNNIIVALASVAGGFLALKGASIFLAVAGAIWKCVVAMRTLNLVMLANPISLLIKSLAVLAGAFAAAWQASDIFKYKIKTAWQEIQYEISEGVKNWGKSVDMLGLSPEITKKYKNIGAIDQSKETPEQYSERLRQEMGLTLEEIGKFDDKIDSISEKVGEMVNDFANMGDSVKETSKDIDNTLNGYKSDKELIFPSVEVETATKKNKTQKNVFTDEFWADIKKEAFEFENKAETELSPVAERVGRDFASSVRQAIQGEYETTEDAIRDIGANLIYSLADEMLANTTNYLANALSQIGTFVISSMKGFFGIASPSKVFKSIGYDNMRGLALGFSENQDIVDNATSGVADKVKAGLENIDANIMPAFNLQALKEMFNINAVTQPQIAGAVAGGGVTININSTFNMTGSGGTGQSQGVTADDLNAFSKDIENRIKGVVNKELMNKMRAGGMLSR